MQKCLSLRQVFFVIFTIHPLSLLKRLQHLNYYRVCPRRTNDDDQKINPDFFSSWLLPVCVRCERARFGHNKGAMARILHLGVPPGVCGSCRHDLSVVENLPGMPPHAMGKPRPHYRGQKAVQRVLHAAQLRIGPVARPAFLPLDFVGCPPGAGRRNDLPSVGAFLRVTLAVRVTHSFFRF